MCGGFRKAGLRKEYETGKRDHQSMEQYDLSEFLPLAACSVLLVAQELSETHPRFHKTTLCHTGLEMKGVQALCLANSDMLLHRLSMSKPTVLSGCARVVAAVLL